jgi:ectoine hydroxylase-related dioxygenase (phytanoyl-CoA dioxygenase family)
MPLTEEQVQVSLTEEQVQSVKQQGFLLVPRITSDEEALKIKASLERLFEEKAGWKEGAYGELATSSDDKEPNSPQILLPVNYAPELHKTECFANALRIAKQVLGEKADFILDLAIYKRPGSGEATPWHQDQAFRDPKFDYHEVTIWVALRDVDANSGCLMFLPESHHGQVLEHRRTNRNGESIALQCCAEFDKSTAVKAEIPLGGCTLHVPKTLHCSTTNASGEPRIVYIMTFGTAPTPAETEVTYAWQDNTVTEMQERRRKWMRNGGAFVTAWRRVRRGDLKDWRKLSYLGIRAVRTIVRGR